MRLRLFVFIMLLHTVRAPAAEVRVGTAMRSLVPTMQHLRDLCGVPGSYDACTRFVAWKLEASCERDGDTWRMRATASFTPWIVLYNIHELSHELDHVRDLRTWAGDFAGALEQLRFDSSLRCQEKILQERGGFEKTIRGFAAASNAIRDPLAYARR
jgi:hypothetical protein